MIGGRSSEATINQSLIIISTQTIPEIFEKFELILPVVYGAVNY